MDNYILQTMYSFQMLMIIGITAVTFIQMWIVIIIQLWCVVTTRTVPFSQCG